MAEQTKEEVKEEAVHEKKEEEAQHEKPFDKMTAPELREIAKEIPGVTGVHAMKKAELLKLIKEDKGIEDEKPLKKSVKPDKGALSVSELKAKISALREEKAAAREAKDREKLDVLRRRINRLKKMTRKAARA